MLFTGGDKQYILNFRIFIPQYQPNHETIQAFHIYSHHHFISFNLTIPVDPLPGDRGGIEQIPLPVVYILYILK
jgi:hypothetical protein